MNGLTSAIGQVTGFFTLAAFLAAALVLYHRFRLREESRRLESLPKDERAAAAEALLGRLKISVEGLPDTQRYKLAKQQLETLQRRDRYRFALTLIAMLVGGALWWQSQRSRPEPIRKADDTATELTGDVARDLSPRFEFSFLYPRTWDRLDPENGDGHRFADPTDSTVTCAFYGSYTMPDTVDATPEAVIGAEVDMSLREERSKPGFKLFANVESGRFAHLSLPIPPVSDTDTGETKYAESWQHIAGRRVVYRTLEDGEPITHMSLFLAYKQRSVGATCEAPDSKFKAYEPLFLKLLAGLRVLDTGRR